MNPWHVILIRSSYDSDKTPDSVNRRRLHLTRCLCASSLRSQTSGNFSVIVQVHPRDKMLSERMAVFETLPCNSVHFWNNSRWSEAIRACIPAEATHAIQTRMDDDDAIAMKFVEYLQESLDNNDRPTWYTFPKGARVVGDRYSGKTQIGNQFISLQVPANSKRTVFDLVHGRVRRAIQVDDRMLGWIWYRHPSARSKGGFTRATASVDRLKSGFCVDWDGLRDGPHPRERKMDGLRVILGSGVPPRVVVECGMLEGKLTERLGELFGVVHSIEKSPELYGRRPACNARFHLGDSRDVLPTLELNEACLFFLDSHWFDSKVQGVAGEGEFPLWDEIDWISRRPYADIVVVDDVHAFGREGEWKDVTPERLAERLGRVESQRTLCDMHAMRRSTADNRY